jgi:hypothetical protein
LDTGRQNACRRQKCEPTDRFAAAQDHGRCFTEFMVVMITQDSQACFGETRTVVATRRSINATEYPRPISQGRRAAAGRFAQLPLPLP